MVDLAHYLNVWCSVMLKGDSIFSVTKKRRYWVQEGGLEEAITALAVHHPETSKDQQRAACSVARHQADSDPLAFDLPVRSRYDPGSHPHGVTLARPVVLAGGRERWAHSVRPSVSVYSRLSGCESGGTPGSVARLVCMLFSCECRFYWFCHVSRRMQRSFVPLSLVHTSQTSRKFSFGINTWKLVSCVLCQ